MYLNQSADPCSPMKEGAKVLESPAVFHLVAAPAYVWEVCLSLLENVSAHVFFSGDMSLFPCPFVSLAPDVHAEPFAFVAFFAFPPTHPASAISIPFGVREELLCWVQAGFCPELLYCLPAAVADQQVFGLSRVLAGMMGPLHEEQPARLVPEDF